MHRFFPALSLAALAWCGACSDGQADRAGVGNEAREVRVEVVDAQQLASRIAARNGRGLIVNLWAMW